MLLITVPPNGESLPGQHPAPLLGEKPALSLAYTVIYYCRKVIIINRELHLLREIRDREEHEIISHVKPSPLDFATRGGLSRHLRMPPAVQTGVQTTDIHTHSLFLQPSPFLGYLFATFSLFSPGSNQYPPLLPSEGTFPSASATETQRSEPGKQFTPFPAP